MCPDAGLRHRPSSRHLRLPQRLRPDLPELGPRAPQQAVFSFRSGLRISWPW
jgi:hypothetical protein